jgi:hypothetical protein
MGRKIPVSQMTDAQVLKACRPKVKGYKETELQKYPRPCLLCGVQVEGTLGDLERHQSIHVGPQYDYDNQAWIVNGKYENCAHPVDHGCQCYGRLHQGENAPSIH